MTLTKFNEIVMQQRQRFKDLKYNGKLIIAPRGESQEILIQYINPDDMFVCYFFFKTNIVIRNSAAEILVTFIESDYARQHCAEDEIIFAKALVKIFEEA